MEDAMRMVSRVVLVAAIALMSTSALPGQTPATGQVMRNKLSHSHQILEAIMTSNFALLEQESAALGEATKSPAWAVLKTPQYARYSTDFVRRTDDLVAAAKDRDLDTAIVSYLSMTMSCYECHRYVKGTRR
jgi:hypothetical protein